MLLGDLIINHDNKRIPLPTKVTVSEFSSNNVLIMPDGN